jgi:hypothetical protein
MVCALWWLTILPSLRVVLQRTHAAHASLTWVLDSNLAPMMLMVECHICSCVFLSSAAVESVSDSHTISTRSHTLSIVVYPLLGGAVVRRCDHGVLCDVAFQLPNICCCSSLTCL